MSSFFEKVEHKRRSRWAKLVEDGGLFQQSANGPITGDQICSNSFESKQIPANTVLQPFLPWTPTSWITRMRLNIEHRD
jgi:hypothetical protein